MVEVSKHLFEQACSDVSCHLLVHPWHRSCFVSTLETYKNSFIGSAKFYSLVYLAQVLMRGKKILKKEEYTRMAEYYARSTILGGLISSNVAVLSCLLRWLNGRMIGYYSYMFIPGVINGVCIYLEPPSRRGLVINLFCNLVIEYWLRTLERNGYISLTKSKQTIMFMAGSAALFYLMRLEGDKKQRTPLFWLYTPERVRRKSDESTSICPHEGSCKKHIVKGCATYFAIGLAITVARTIVPKLGTPIQALSTFQWKHFKMAMFFGNYIGIYRAVICYLSHRSGHDAAEHAIPAGYLAGLSFVFNPNLGFSIASLTAAFKLYSTILYERKLLPKNWPLPELIYCFCQGALFHARFMHPVVCPSYVFKLVSTVSNGRSEIIYANMVTAIKRTII